MDRAPFVGPDVGQRALLPHARFFLVPDLDRLARSLDRFGQGGGHEGAERIAKDACAAASAFG